MNNDLILLIIALITLMNTIIIVPSFKFVIWCYKEISFIKGKIDIE